MKKLDLLREEFVSYGKNKFSKRINNFRPIVDIPWGGLNKPVNGCLWASPKKSHSSWVKYVQKQNFLYGTKFDTTKYFDFRLDCSAKIYCITTSADVVKLMRICGAKQFKHSDRHEMITILKRQDKLFQKELKDFAPCQGEAKAENVNWYVLATYGYDGVYVKPSRRDSLLYWFAKNYSCESICIWNNNIVVPE